MALGLRYPKAHETGHIRSSGAGTNNQSAFPFGTGGRYLTTQAGQWFYVNPSKYSELRKVVVWCSCRLLDASPPNAQIRMRLTMSSSSSSSLSPMVATISPGSIVRVQGASSIYPNPPSDEAVLFNKAGSYEDLQAVSSFSDRATTFVRLEFTRFEASSAEFFNAWDQIAASADTNEYLQIIPVLEIQGSDWNTEVTNLQLFNFGLSIVQAPTGVNRTTTFMNLNCGWISYGNEASGAAFGASRAWPFCYDASQWDNVTSMHVWSILPVTGGGSTPGNWNLELKLAHLPPNSGSVADVSRYTETFADAGIGSSNVVALHRSQDVFPSIQDGDNLAVEWRNLAASNAGQPWAYLEIIQEDFNLTVCPHVASISGPVERSEVATPGTTYYYSKGFFDPLWYQSFTSDLILANRVWGGLKHANPADTTREQVITNGDLQADPNTSAFNAITQPEVSSTPQGTNGYKIQNGEITQNNPINFAGVRVLIGKFFTPDGLLNAGQPGGVMLAYALNVPNREFLDQGPLFDIGAFDPEGCASTSAGLGDNPGILVITNGSTTPKKFNPDGDSTSQIEDAGMPQPFPDEDPGTQVNDTAASPAGGLEQGFYNYRYTFRNCCTGKESNPSDPITVDTSGASPAASVTLSFAGVRIPADPQICEICIYRTVVSSTEEELSDVVLAKVGCFNVDEATTFVDDLADDELDFTNDGLSLLNAPMPCVPIVVEFRNRLFGMGDIPNLAPAGTVSVENGSDIIQGDGSVEWDRCLEGKFIKVAGDCRAYEIDRVLPPEAGTSPPIARLRLTEEYEGSTDNGLSYTLCGRPNRLYISEPLEPECWPEANFLDIEPGDGDRLMGAASNFDSLVICKRRKTYVLRFREQPATEVVVPSRISSDIGCIGPRTFAQVESGTVWLSDRGLALYDGRSVQHVPASEAMNDIFVNDENPNYVRRDRNGRVIDAVGVFYPKREQYLLLLPTVQTERGCDMMLVWDTKLQNVTLLKFCQEFQSMVVGKDAEGNERVYLGDTNGFVWIFDIGYTDGVGAPNSTGTVRGAVSAAGTDDDGADFLRFDQGGFITGGLPGLAGISGQQGLSGAWDGDDLGLAGVCVFTRAAGAALDAPWTSRTIYAATNDTLYVTPPWGDEAPSAGDDFMVGAIDFDCLFKPQNYGVEGMSKRNWAHIVVHEREDFASKLRVQLLPDFRLNDPEELTVIDPVTQETGEGRLFRMDYEFGRQRRPVGREVHFYEGVRFKNFAPEEPIRIINHVLLAEVRKG